MVIAYTKKGVSDFEATIQRCARRAAFLIKRDGWFRGLKGRGNNGERCAMMAIVDAAEFLIRSDKAKTRKDRADHIAIVTRWRCEELIDPKGRWRHSGSRRKKYLAYWNDKTGQTADNVLAILKRVAAGERSPYQRY